MKNLNDFVFEYRTKKAPEVNSKEVGVDDFDEYAMGKKKVPASKIKSVIKPGNDAEDNKTCAEIKPPVPEECTPWKEIVQNFENYPEPKQMLIDAFNHTKRNNFFLIGRAGWAKTRTIEHLAWSRGYTVCTVYLAHALPEDLGGKEAAFDLDGKPVSKLLPPTWVGAMLEWEDSHPGTKWCLFLDEFNQADADTMNSIMSIFEEHTIANVHFENMIVGGAGNFYGENDSVNEIKNQGPLWSRIHYKIDWTPEHITEENQAEWDELWVDHFRWAHKKYDPILGEDLVNEIEKVSQWLKSPRDISTTIYEKIENELELLESDPDYVVTNTPKMMYKNIMKNCIPTNELKPSVLTSRSFINGIEHLAEAICNYVKSGSASTTSSKRKATNKDGNQVDKDCKQDIIIALGKGYFEFPPEEGGDGTRYIVTKDNAITKVFDPSVTGITAEVYNKILREMKASGKKPKFESENDPAVKEILKDKRYVLVPDDEQQFLVTDKLKKRQVAEEPQADRRRHISDYA